jgi:hypothetical protein
MAHRIRFAKARQPDFGGAFEPAEPRRDGRHIGQVDAATINRALLEQQRLLEHERAVAGEGRDLGDCGFGEAANDAVVGSRNSHASTSSSASSNASKSASVAVSVTATTSPLASAALSG